MYHRYLTAVDGPVTGAVPLHAYLDRVAGERPATMVVPGRP